jgi:glycosyltransferase involved in cell wall biosynthesis
MITVLLASYNGEKYIGQQLDSVLAQTVDDLRIVISDDVSSDRTREIIEEYQIRFPDKVTSLEVTEPSGGAAANFFRLLSSVSDDYVMLCDQDDIWLPDKVEKTLERMKAMENRYGKDKPILVHTDLSITDSEGTILHQSMARYQKIASDHNSLNHYLVENNITGNTVMINRAFTGFFTYIPEECSMHDWWLGLLASSFGEISYVNQPLVLYRQHGNNELGAKSEAEQYAQRLRSDNGVRENYRKMFKQAELLLAHYKDILSEEQMDLLEHFLEIPHLSRFRKINTIWKYRLFKSTLIRTLGQMLFI